MDECSREERLLIGAAVLVGLLMLAVRGVLNEIGPQGVRDIAAFVGNRTPPMQLIDDSRWFGGDTVVPGGVSEAIPLNPPCPSPGTAAFEEEFRSRKCSVIIYAEGEDRFLFWGWHYPIRQSQVSQNVFSAADDIHSNHGDRYFMTRTRSFQPPAPGSAGMPKPAKAQEPVTPPADGKCTRTAFTSADFRGDGQRYLVDALECGGGNKVVITGTEPDGRAVRCELTHYGRWSIDRVKTTDEKQGTAETLEITSSYGSNRSIEFVHWSRAMLKVYDFERPGDFPLSCQSHR